MYKQQMIFHQEIHRMKCNQVTVLLHIKAFEYFNEYDIASYVSIAM